jgi:hypothetical protein
VVRRQDRGLASRGSARTPRTGRGRLIAAHARLRGVAEEVAFVPDGRTLARTRLLTLDTDDGGLDLLADPPGAPPCAAMRDHADRVDLDGIVVAVAALDDLLR